MLTMLHHMCMWNINLDFQQWKQSEQSNPMKDCVWTMGSLFKIISHTVELSSITRPPSSLTEVRH
jgi:hypothetical protein